MSAARPHVRIVRATGGAQIEQARTLFVEYAEALGIDLGFQDFEAELQSLPGAYAPPHGTLLLALVEDDLAGCCALRPLEGTAYTNAAELKRLYVRTMYRGFGLGRQLAERVLEAASHIGYANVLLDTLDDMEAARTLYEDLGFREIPPYYANPLPGTHYLRTELRRS